MIIGVPREVKTDEYRVGMRPAGVEMLTRMARAMSLPAETLFRAAGLIPSEDLEAEQPPEEVPVRLGEWVRMFMEAEEGTREIMLENARFFAQRAAHKKKAEQG